MSDNGCAFRTGMEEESTRGLEQAPYSEKSYVKFIGRLVIITNDERMPIPIT